MLNKGEVNFSDNLANFYKGRLSFTIRIDIKSKVN